MSTRLCIIHRIDTGEVLAQTPMPEGTELAGKRAALLAVGYALQEVPGWPMNQYGGNTMSRKAAAKKATKKVPSKKHTTKYPNVHVQLTGQPGPGLTILGRAVRALQQAGVPKEERERFFAEAVSNGYDHLIGTVMRWVAVDAKEAR
jgi:hypothetical protein